jgi:hypothetical protein
LSEASPCTQHHFTKRLTIVWKFNDATPNKFEKY